MSRSLELASVLLLSTALVAPSAARAQAAPAPQSTPPATAPDQSTPVDQQAAQEPPAPDVSIPGGADVVVTARRTGGNLARSSTQSISVLSSADIARTGEGDIAGALGRVTGLSVVGNGFVYVRGLGDRYSLALLNGSPLPSPEPLRRVVPLDIFPTNIISSSLVQKSYSVNFPGEFGGGVINLTTKSVPKEGFVTIGATIGADTVTTGQLGYTYFGSSSDFTGFDNGARRTPPALANFLASGQNLAALTPAQNQAIASQLVTGANAIVQRNQALPPNWSFQLSAGKSWDVGDYTLGLIGTFGYSNKWRTRDTTQQTASTLDLSQRELDFERVITDNRLVVDGLVGGSLEWARNKIRWTTVFVRDTLKQARIGIGTRATTSSSATLQQQDTAFFARQLIDTQLAGEFKLNDKFALDLRAGYANSRRNAPSELSFEYFRANNPAEADGLGTSFVNFLNNGNRGSASVRYSFLNENLYSTSADLSYKAVPNVTLSLGYSYSDTFRRTEVREFLFTAQGFDNSNLGVTLFRPDLLLQPAVIRAFNINLIDQNPANPVFGSSLVVHAGYGRAQIDLFDKLNIDLGLRYEAGDQRVRAIQVFSTPTASLAQTSIQRDYLLPAITLTYKISPEMQVRLSGSKTVARPQFRELVFQNYFDPDNNRLFRGNPLLIDSQLYNAEGRWEWYFARDQRLSVAGFYKRINHPIESFASFSDNTVTTSFANAPRADLFGGEIETQKYFALDSLFGNGKFWSARRAVVIANYTYTNSSINVRANDPAALFGFSGVTLASQLFRNGVPLTGQSDHVANLELGLENKDHLSQQTLLLNYASRRATLRGGSGQPDIFEYPGFRLDFVARQGVRLLGVDSEIKFEARNITGTRYREFQENGANRIYYNLYSQGTTLTLGWTVNF